MESETMDELLATLTSRIATSQATVMTFNLVWSSNLLDMGGGAGPGTCSVGPVTCSVGPVTEKLRWNADGS